MGGLRKPFFVIAIIAIGLVVLVELGSALLIGGHNVSGQFAAGATDLGVRVGDTGTVSEPVSRGISYLALIDVIVLYTALLMAASLLLPDKVHARLQGIVTLVAAIVLIIVAIILLIVAFVELIVMVTLFFAFPFGTIAYLAIWGFFPRGDAAAVLSLLMFLKLVFAGMLILAQQRFLQNKGLVALVLTSLVANVVLVFLHGLVPAVMVSILDDVGAVIFAVVAIIWAIVLLIGSIPAIIKALRTSTVG